MSPTFSFNDVDVVTTRNSLRKLLDFFGGRRKQSFLISLYMVENTLFLERCEKSVRLMLHGSANSGWGHNFERAFTTFPPGLEDSTAYHRALAYNIGDVRCVVRFEVDARYKEGDNPNTDTDSLAAQMQKMSVNSRSKAQSPDEHTGTRSSAEAVSPQSEAAELKTAAGKVSAKLTQSMPQLWFGRTPWLIIGSHTDGTFTELHVSKASDKFKTWETQEQLPLRKLAAALPLLRDCVKTNGGKKCVAICEKSTDASVLRIHPAEKDAKPLPDELITRFWTKSDVKQGEGLGG